MKTHYVECRRLVRRSFAWALVAFLILIHLVVLSIMLDMVIVLVAAPYSFVFQIPGGACSCIGLHYACALLKIFGSRQDRDFWLWSGVVSFLLNLVLCAASVMFAVSPLIFRTHGVWQRL